MGKRIKKFDTATETAENQRHLGKKKYTIHDLNIFQPLTNAQSKFLSAWESKDDVIFQIGCAGTGKTALTLNAMFETLFTDNTYEKILIVRSAVVTREIGHLPGSKEEKEEIFSLPYQQLIDEMFKFNKSYDNLVALDKVEFITTTHLRGLTFDRTLVLLDEVQNFDFSELETAFTRLGNHSRIVLCGDSNQDDLARLKAREKSGLGRFINIMEHVQQQNNETHISFITYEPEDIVRSGIVRDYLITKHKLNL